MVRLGKLAGGTALIILGVAAQGWAQNTAPPLPTGADVESANAAGKLTVKLEPPLANPRDFQGVWFPPARVAGAGAPGRGGPPGGGGAPGGGPPAGAPPGGGSPAGGGATATNTAGLECAPRQVAFAAGAGFTMGINQSPDTMVLMNEESQNYRFIYLNAEHPANIPPSQNGHSVAHWEGDTLVVDTIGAVGRDGKPSATHTIERVKKSDDGSQLIVEMSTANAPAGAAPRASRLQWRPDLFVSESVCEESYAEFTVVNGMVVLTQQVEAETKK